MSSQNIHQFFKGQFVKDAAMLQQQLQQCKAFVFDWDGVFNDGTKDQNGSSSFSEVDAMGTNLLRFSHYLRTGQAPLAVIISGEKNNAAFSLAQREHFDSVYFKIKHKVTALQHLCQQYQLQPNEVFFVFDDVLDFSAAQQAGLRFMVKHTATVLLQQYAVNNGLVDYITNGNGGAHAIRETTELLMYLAGNYNETITGRMEFSKAYQDYLAIRQSNTTIFYTAAADNGIIPSII